MEKLIVPIPTTVIRDITAKSLLNRAEKNLLESCGINTLRAASCVELFSCGFVDLVGRIAQFFTLSIFFCVTHKVRTWNSKNLLSRFLPLLHRDYSPTNTIPYGVCLRCKLSTAQRISGALWGVFAPRFCLYSDDIIYRTGSVYGTVLIWRGKSSVFQCERAETAGAINGNVNTRRIHLFSLRGQKVFLHIRGNTAALFVNFPADWI